MARRKIPYGISDYQVIQDENYLYVDKTRFIEELEYLSTKYPVFLRPRRFGKTLLVSTLQYYYDKNFADEFDTLFGDTYIGTHKTALANSYYVMRFDFSKLDAGSEEMLKKSFYRSVRVILKDFDAYYGLDISIEDNSDYNSADLLDGFLREANQIIGRKLYIMIDEYDHFANSILSNRQVFTKITSKEGFVRSFYEVFKTHTSGSCIDRIFITGVTSLTLDSLTSGFNIAKNVSMFPELNEMTGFTSEETKYLLKEADVTNKENIEGTMEILTENYNGYRFHKSIENKVFNSNMVLYFLDEYQRAKGLPDQLTDPNMTSDYQKLTAMFDLFDDEETKQTILEQIMSNERLETDIITNFDFSIHFGKEDFLSLLFYLGLLTIKGEGTLYDVQLQTPNYVIRDIYYQYYGNYLHVQPGKRRTAVGMIALYNDFEEYNRLIESILKLHKESPPHLRSAESSDEDYKDFHESRLKSIMLSCFGNQNFFLVKSEYPVNGKRIDIALFDRRRRDQKAKTKYNYLLEIKYIPKAQASSAKIEVIKAQATSQMQEYLQLEEFEGDACLRGYIYIVVKDKIIYFEEVTR